MRERTGTRDPTVWEWLTLAALGLALFVYGTVSARTGLPPQPETVAGPIFDQVAGFATVAFAAVGLVTHLRWTHAGRHAPARAATRPAQPVRHVRQVTTTPAPVRPRAAGRGTTAARRKAREDVA